jgi:hypothetical protein
MEPKGSLQCSHETAGSHSHRLCPSVCKTRSNMISPPPTAVSFMAYLSFTKASLHMLVFLFHIPAAVCSFGRFRRQCYDLLLLQWGLFFAFIIEQIAMSFMHSTFNLVDFL